VLTVDDMRDTNASDAQLLTKAQAAHRLAVSERTVDRMAANGHLTRIFLPGGSFRFGVADIDALVASGARRPGSEG
jgi:excisionase family DNA binding protein